MVGVKRRSRIILQVRMREIYPRNPVDHHSHLNVHPTLALVWYRFHLNMPYIAYLFHLLIIPTRAAGNPELEAALPYQQIYLETVLNQSQGGMCICLRRGIVPGVSRECFGP